MKNTLTYQNYLTQMLLMACVFSMSIRVVAQDQNTAVQQISIEIPEVAILDLESSKGSTIEFRPEAGREAGMAVDFSKQLNSDLWINYSSIVSKQTQPNRGISVQITSGSIPAGLRLSVTASDYTGIGDGEMGRPTQTVALSRQSREVISGIGSAYTGNGVQNGHQLTYQLELGEASGSYEKLDFDASSTVVITYTFTDN